MGLDSKALVDAANGIQSKYPDMCVMLWSVDESKGKALALAVCHECWKFKNSAKYGTNMELC